MDPNVAPTLQHSPHVWEAQRERFTHLYMTENKPLKEVRKIMRDRYEFDATARQYKRRIIQWGLQKNSRAAEKSHILTDLSNSGTKLEPNYIYRFQGKDIAAHKLHRFAKMRSLQAPQRTRVAGTSMTGHNIVTGETLIELSLLIGRYLAEAFDGPNEQVTSPAWLRRVQSTISYALDSTSRTAQVTSSEIEEFCRFLDTCRTIVSFATPISKLLEAQLPGKIRPPYRCIPDTLNYAKLLCLSLRLERLDVGMYINEIQDIVNQIPSLVQEILANYYSRRTSSPRPKEIESELGIFTPCTLSSRVVELPDKPQADPRKGSLLSSEIVSPGQPMTVPEPSVPIRMHDWILEDHRQYYRNIQNRSINHGECQSSVAHQSTLLGAGDLVLSNMKAGPDVFMRTVSNDMWTTLPAVPEDTSQSEEGIFPTDSQDRGQEDSIIVPRSADELVDLSTFATGNMGIAPPRNDWETELLTSSASLMHAGCEWNSNNARGTCDDTIVDWDVFIDWSSCEGNQGLPMLTGGSGAWTTECFVREGRPLDKQQQFQGEELRIPDRGSGI